MSSPTGRDRKSTLVPSVDRRNGLRAMTATIACSRTAGMRTGALDERWQPVRYARGVLRLRREHADSRRVDCGAEGARNGSGLGEKGALSYEKWFSLHTTSHLCGDATQPLVSSPYAPGGCGNATPRRAHAAGVLQHGVRRSDRENDKAQDLSVLGPPYPLAAPRGFTCPRSRSWAPQ